MGSYSFFEYESIEITDKKGLFDWIMEIKDSECFEDYMWGNYLVDIIDGKDFSFESWDNIKLISYWYDNQVKFLDKISDFIEGSVDFSFESHEEHATIRFKDKKTIFSLGNMEYIEHTANDLLKIKIREIK